MRDGLTCVRPANAGLLGLLGLLALLAVVVWQQPPARSAQAPVVAPPYQQAIVDAHRRFKDVREGRVAGDVPALARANPALFGISIVSLDGRLHEIGDAAQTFSSQSISKVFVLARAIEEVGPDTVEKRIGVDATGQPFNSVLAIGLSEVTRRHPAGNPLVNAGAISTIDLLAGSDAEAKWQRIIGTLGAFAGHPLTVDDEIYRFQSENNFHNRGIANLMKDHGVIRGDPMQALDLYTRQCSVNITTRDLAVMGATLANGGRNPLTGVQVISPATAERVLGVMATAGLYENSGTWLFRVGAPAKSGVGGGIVAVVPGRFAIASFSPLLDPAGNSVRAQLAIEAVLARLGGNPFHATPVVREQR